MSHTQRRINIVTLNCWGLWYISKYRHERLSHIGHLIAHPEPAQPGHSVPPLPDIVCLQECWTQEDYESIRAQTEHILPYGKFYYSGVLGAGLVILSRWPIIGSSMRAYPLNGRPTAFFRGDWYVGKGVACATISIPDESGWKSRDPAVIEADPTEAQKIIEVFTTHLHAPYEQEPNDSYLCHRTAQAYFISKLLRDARERHHLAIACGDFNMIPDSFAHKLVTTQGGVEDVWNSAPNSPRLVNIDDDSYPDRQHDSAPKVKHKVLIEGCTCDSAGNTWRWDEKKRKGLERSVKRGRKLDEQYKKVDWDEKESPGAKRLDYIFFGQPVPRGANRDLWTVQRKAVGMMQRHPKLLCSLSDHFAVEATLEYVHSRPGKSNDDSSAETVSSSLPQSTYQAILDLTATYITRERFQRKARIGHFFISVAVSIGCWIAVWWSPRNFVAFLLMLLSSLGLMAGAVDGLIGFLFVGSEMACLKEFQWEIETLAKLGTRG